VSTLGTSDNDGVDEVDDTDSDLFRAIEIDSALASAIEDVENEKYFDLSSDSESEAELDDLVCYKFL
jgi:hypothetical protein